MIRQYLADRLVPPRFELLNAPWIARRLGTVKATIEKGVVAMYFVGAGDAAGPCFTLGYIAGIASTLIVALIVRCTLVYISRACASVARAMIGMASDDARRDR